MLNRRHGITLTDIVGIFAIAIIVRLFMFFAIITSTNTPATVQVPVGSQISILVTGVLWDKDIFVFSEPKVIDGMPDMLIINYYHLKLTGQGSSQALGDFI